MVLFVAGTFGQIKKNGTGAGAMVREGVHYYFRVLLPWIVISCVLLLVFVVITIVTIFTEGGSCGLRGYGYTRGTCHDPDALFNLLLRHGRGV